MHSADTWTVQKVDQKYLESFESWRRMEKICRTDYVKNEEVLYRVKEEKNILHRIKQSLAGLDTSCEGTTF